MARKREEKDLCSKIVIFSLRLKQKAIRLRRMALHVQLFNVTYALAE
jgi:hypothetical protein